MTTKQLASLALAAVVLGGLAFLSSNNKRMKTPLEVGKPVLKHLDLSAVQQLQVKENNKVKLALAGSDAGWVVKSLYGYPADITKIRANLLKLAELKIGQVATGRKLKDAQVVDFENAAGKSLAVLRLGETHNRAPSGQMAQFGGGGGYPDGRYVATEGETVYLVSDSLEMFNDGPKSWVDTQIASVPSAEVVTAEFARGDEKLTLSRATNGWSLAGLGPNEELDSSKAYGIDSGLNYLNFSSVADPAVKPEVTGFATGAVYTVTLSNGERYAATVGNASGADRYCKLAASFAPVGTNTAAQAASKAKVDAFNAKNGKWVYLIASYSAESLQKKRSELVKAKAAAKPAAQK